MNESAFQQQIIELAKLRGWLVHHDRPAMDRRGRWASHVQGDVGYPDLTLARRGVVIFAELKAQGKKATEAQLEWLAALPGSHLWWPSDFEEIVRMLE